MKKQIILPVLSLVLFGIIAFGVSQVYAQSNGSNFYSGLVQAIAQKFGLDQGQVQAVVDQYYTQQKQNMQQNMQQREQDRLDKLVQDGKINATQKQAILDELAALKSKYNPADFKNMTADQRKQQFQAQQEEIKAWVQSQGIDQSYLMPGFGRGGRGMFGKGNWVKHQPSPVPAQ